MSYCLYKHTCPNNKMYIGITSQNPIKRWGGGSGYMNNNHFYRAIVKYGWDNIKHEILFTDLTKEEAEQKEIELIAKYQSNNPEYGYNIDNGGNSLGKHSETTKLKISKSHSGKTLTEEHKLKLSQSHKGKKPWNKGVPISDEQKQKQREKMTGKLSGTKHPNTRRIICVETGEQFDCMIFACDKYSMGRGNLWSCLNGKQKTCGGFHWKYI